MSTPARPYAYGTPVKVEKSRAEIENVVAKYGATAFASGHENGVHAIMFTVGDRRVRFVLAPPSADHDLVRYRLNGTPRPHSERPAAIAAEERRRWRTLLIAIKSKLDVVQSGIFTFEEEFAAHIMLPDGSTAGQHLLPAIEHAYSTGTMPSMLGLGTGD